MAVVQHAALSHPEVSFRFLREGKEELNTPGDGSLKSAVYAVLGRDMALGFVPCKGSGEDISVDGFLSKPVCCRGSRASQFFFVNGRYVKSRTMQAALTDTGSLDSEIAALLSEMEVVAELTKRCIEENSTTAQDQATYLERYNGLAERYETAKAKLEKLQAAKAQREAKSEDISGFMFELAEYGEPITEFDDRLWLTVIDTVTVHRDGRLTFMFQTGHEITV